MFTLKHLLQIFLFVYASGAEKNNIYLISKFLVGLRDVTFEYKKYPVKHAIPYPDFVRLILSNGAIADVIKKTGTARVYVKKIPQVVIDMELIRQEGSGSKIGCYWHWNKFTLQAGSLCSQQRNIDNLFKILASPKAHPPHLYKNLYSFHHHMHYLILHHLK